MENLALSAEIDSNDFFCNQILKGFWHRDPYNDRIK